jgi:hypothetical protein
MNTEPLDLTDQQLYANQGLGVEHDHKYGMKIIETNGGYSKLKDVVFTAVILGFGAIVWSQQATNAQIERDIAVLKLACLHNPDARIPEAM